VAVSTDTAADAATDTATDTAAETATESHKWSAVKSPLGAQTVLGDRHDPVCEILLQAPSAACGTRPRELSNGWIRKQMCDRSEKRSSENLIRQRGQRNDLNPGEFASRAGVCVGEVNLNAWNRRFAVELSGARPRRWKSEFLSNIEFRRGIADRLIDIVEVFVVRHDHETFHGLSRSITRLRPAPTRPTYERGSLSWLKERSSSRE